MAWNRPSESKAEPRGGCNRRRPCLKIALAAALIAIAGMIVVWHYLSEPSAQARKPEKASKEVVEESPSVPTPAATARPLPESEPEKEKYLGSEIVSRTATTNKAGFVIERIRTADGKSHRRMHYPKSPFEEATDQYLADILTQSPDNPRPLPDMRNEKGLDEEFRRSLKTKIVINDDDPQKVKELKAMVIMARENMKRTMDETGMSFAEVLVDHQRVTQENSDIRLEALRDLREIMDKGDREGARDFVNTMNEAFGRMGIDAIAMPKALEEKEGEAQ